MITMIDYTTDTYAEVAAMLRLHPFWQKCDQPIMGAFHADLESIGARNLVVLRQRWLGTSVSFSTVWAPTSHGWAYRMYLTPEQFLARWEPA